jgi:O-antigen ligase
MSVRPATAFLPSRRSFRGHRWRAPALPWLTWVAVTMAIVIDTSGRVGLGSVSLSAFISLGVMAVLIALAPLVVGAGLAAVPLPFLLFYGFVVVRLVFAPNPDGLQNAAILTMFTFGIAFSARSATVEVAGATLRVFAGVGVLVAVVFAVGSVSGADVYMTRAFALTALVLLAAAVVLPPTDLLARAAPFVIVGAIVLSLSRTASAISILMLVGLVVRLRRGHRLLLACGAVTGVALAAWALLSTFAPLRDRFLVGDNAVEVGGLAINTSGRSALWEAVSQSAMHAPFLGHGPGSAVVFVTERFGGITQPHNEYLRVLHDEGLVGLIPFVLGCLLVLVRVIKRVARTDQPIHWAALFALTGTLAAAATDNVLVYPFVLLPASVLIGLSLGLPVGLSEQPTTRTRAREPRTGDRGLLGASR